MTSLGCSSPFLLAALNFKTGGVRGRAGVVSKDDVAHRTGRVHRSSREGKRRVHCCSIVVAKKGAALVTCLPYLRTVGGFVVTGGTVGGSDSTFFASGVGVPLYWKAPVTSGMRAHTLLSRPVDFVG